MAETPVSPLSIAAALLASSSRRSHGFSYRPGRVGARSIAVGGLVGLGLARRLEAHRRSASDGLAWIRPPKEWRRATQDVDGVEVRSSPSGEAEASSISRPRGLRTAARRGAAFAHRTPGAVARGDRAVSRTARVSSASPGPRATTRRPAAAPMSAPSGTDPAAELVFDETGHEPGSTPDMLSKLAQLHDPRGRTPRGPAGDRRTSTPTEVGAGPKLAASEFTARSSGGGWPADPAPVRRAEPAIAPSVADRVEWPTGMRASTDTVGPSSVVQWPSESTRGGRERPGRPAVPSGPTAAPWPSARPVDGPTAPSSPGVEGDTITFSETGHDAGSKADMLAKLGQLEQLRRGTAGAGRRRSGRPTPSTGEPRAGRTSASVASEGRRSPDAPADTAWPTDPAPAEGPDPVAAPLDTPWPGEEARAGFDVGFEPIPGAASSVTAPAPDPLGSVPAARPVARSGPSRRAPEQSGPRPPSGRATSPPVAAATIATTTPPDSVPTLGLTTGATATGSVVAAREPSPRTEPGPVVPTPAVRPPGANRRTAQGGGSASSLATALNPVAVAVAARDSSPAREALSGEVPRTSGPRSESGGGSENPSPVPRSPRSLADRFLTVLRDGQRVESRPLPTVFEPLAQKIGGLERVRIATGPISREALAAVNRPAATVGSTIHLSAPPADTPAHREVLAHELVHVSRPSPVPRFFADPVDTEEERQARAVGRAGRRTSSTAEVAGRARRPRSTARGRAVAGAGAVRHASSDRVTAEVIRRSPAGAGSSVSADELADRISGGSRAPVTETADPVIRRSPVDGPANRPQPSNRPIVAPSASPPVIRREVATAPDDWQEATSSDGELADMTVDRLVVMVERRLAERLRRERGRRGWHTAGRV
jgi:Domain of unknown function (DUF4157)